MLKPSRDRITHLARVLVDEIDKAPSVRLLKDKEAIRQSIVHALIEEMRHDEERYHNVLQRLQSLIDAPAAGSREWEQAFSRLLDEEYERTGFDAV